MKYTVMAPGKLILIGEYAVLEGAHALVAAVDRFAIVNITRSKDKHYHIYAKNLDLPDIRFHFKAKETFIFDSNMRPEYQEKLRFVKEICQAAHGYLRSVKNSIIPYDCTLNTSQFYLNNNGPKLGLGSSAAVSVALFMAIRKFAGFVDMDTNLFTNILLAYQTAQGSLGSGVDLAASLLGGVLDYKIKTHPTKPNYVWEKLEINNSLQFFPIWSGRSASTAKFLRQLVKYKYVSKRSYNNIMQRMVLLANKGCMAYREGKGDHFLEIVSEYFLQLKRLSIDSGIPIISDTHDRIAQIVMSAGGAYKPSGAGGGDLGLAFCHSNSIAHKIKELILESGYNVVSLAINNHGVTDKV